jgi:hypothetical protein
LDDRVTTSHWKTWLNTDKEQKARAIVKWLRERLGLDLEQLQIEPYPKTGGYVASFAIPLRSQTWNGDVVEVIALAQRIGRRWTLLGDVHNDLSGWSNECSVTGVVSIEWQLPKLGDANVHRS